MYISDKCIKHIHLNIKNKLIMKLLNKELIAEIKRQRYDKMYPIYLSKESVKLLQQIIGAVMFEHANKVNKSDVIAVAITNLYDALLKDFKLSKVFLKKNNELRRMKYDKRYQIGLSEHTLKSLYHTIGHIMHHCGCDVKKSDAIEVAVQVLHHDIMNP